MFEQNRFAASGLTYYDQRLTFVNHKVDAVENFLGAESPAQIFDSDYRRGHHLHLEQHGCDDIVGDENHNG